MKKVMSVLLILSFSLVVNARDLRFIEGGVDTLWDNSENWGVFTPPDGLPDAPALPTSEDFVSINGSGADGRGVDPLDVLIDSSTTAEANTVRVGDYDTNRPVSLTVDGGSLDVAGDGFWSLSIGHDGSTTGTVNINSGSVYAGANMFVGTWGSGTLNMNGGTLDVFSFLVISEAPEAGDGVVNLNGGIITVGDLSIKDRGILNVGDGTLRIYGNKLTKVQSYITEEKIVATNPNATVNVVHDSSTDLTLITAGSKDLVAAWDFEDGVASSVASDVSGYAPAKDGTLNGDASIVDDPDRGLVLSCDGDNDYVDCGDDAKFVNSSEMTFAAWIKVNDFSETNWQSIVTKGAGSWRIYRSSNTIIFACTGVGTDWDTSHVAAPTTIIGDEKWHHIVCVYDGSSLSVYCDEVLAATKTVSSDGAIWVTDDPVYIGGNYSEPENDFNGLIDDVEIFNYGMTSSEIMDRYAPPSCENPPFGDINIDCAVDFKDLQILSEDWLNPDITPVAHYEFEGTGSVAIDSSGNGYDGTIVGAARVAGKYGNALEWNSLDGGDYVLVDDVLSNLTNTVTVTLWQNGNPEMQPQVDYVFDSAPQEKVFRGHIPHGDELIYWDAGGNDYLDNVDRINKAASDPNQYEGQWNHWAFVKNAVTGEMKIYLNGELWQAGTGHFEPIDVTSLTIGSRNDPDGQGYVYNYDGLIDDFRIYDVVLTEAEITNVMNNKVTSAANLNGDDNVNLADLAELTANWLVEVD